MGSALSGDDERLRVLLEAWAELPESVKDAVSALVLRSLGEAEWRWSGVRDQGSASQIFTVLSPLPLTIRFPSGLKLTLMTSSECPLSVCASVPLISGSDAAC